MIFFSEAQNAFRNRMKDFAAKELAHGARERAKLDHVTSDVIRKIADEGLLSLTIPKKYGGQPIDCISIGIVFEEISKVDFSPMPLILSHVVIPLMMESADEELRHDWLSALGTGKKLACFGNTEPDCGSDAAAIKTRAVRDDDFYIITGEKTSISMGMQADVIALTAKTEYGAGVKGVTCFVVPLDLPGISRSGFVDMGARPSGRASIFFSDVRVPLRCRIGKEGEGFTKIMSGFDLARVMAALSGIGMAEASLAEGIEYAKTRAKFGNPLCNFEGVSFKLAEDATLLEASRLMCYKALGLRDQGLPYRKEAAMAKWYAAKCSVSIIHDILLILGCRGYSEANPTEQRLRDAFGLQIGDGTPEIMKLIIAREIFGNKIAPIM